MKITVLCIMLIVLSMQGNIYAQDTYVAKHSKEDRLFNIYPPIVNNIHTAYLLKNEKMIIELADLSDYGMLNSLDSVLADFMHDIEFYKDSLPATGNVRIDYSLTAGTQRKMIRFKKYVDEGDLYVQLNGETSKLKINQDTVHIVFNKKPDDRGNRAHFYDWPAQVTFCLNNYTDIDTLLNNKGLIIALVDTLSKAITPPKNNPERGFPNVNTTQSEVDYYPYRKDGKIWKSNVLLPSSGMTPIEVEKRHHVVANAQVGAGLVRNTLAPMVDLGVQYDKFWGWNTQNISIFRLSATPYYFFSKDAQGNFLMNDNWFVNATIGSIEEHNIPDWFGKETTLGLGYLVFEKGGYFKNMTFKVFTDLKINNWTTIVPEIIVTNNCKQIFPGITVKLF